MKKFKTKISLFIATLACLGAGAFTLTSDTIAKAAFNPSNYLGTENGASVCLDLTREGDEGKDENGNTINYVGIRWMTKIGKVVDWPTDAQFGLLVAPASQVAAEDLTHDFVQNNSIPTQDLKFDPGYFHAGGGAGVDITNASADYYSMIYFNYVDGDDTDMSRAYALDFNVRSYVKTGGQYYYSADDATRSSRSVRDVAIAAELSGYIDATYRDTNSEKYDLAKAATAVSYYRGGKTGEDAQVYTPTVKSTGAVGTPVIDLENKPTNQKPLVVEFEIGEGEAVDKVLLGAETIMSAADIEKMPEAAVINGTTLTLKLRLTGKNFVQSGEQYITLITTNGNIYTTPVVVADKVIKTAEDLAMFNTKGTGETADTLAQTLGRYDGYYVLGNNIEANGYSHGSKNPDGTTFNNAKWSGNYNDYRGSKGKGLRGTFNGMGYTIKDLTIGSMQEGLFGIVSGGTVKNVAFTNVKSTLDIVNSKYYGYKYVLAHYLIDATIENVHIQSNTYVTDDANNPGFAMKESALLAYSAHYGTTITNCVLDYGLTNTANDGNASGGVAFAEVGDNFTFNNVYAVSNNKFGGKYTHCLTLEKTGALLANNDPENGQASGTFVIHSNQYTGTLTVATGSVYRYDTLADLYSAQKNSDAYKALADTGLWTVAEDGTLTLVEREDPEVEDPGDTPEDPGDTPEETSGYKILIIGNSHAHNTFGALPEVLNAQGVTSYTLGICKQAGTGLNDFASYIDNEAEEFQYYLSQSTENNGKWQNPFGRVDGAQSALKKVKMEEILKAQAWDYIFMQLGPEDPLKSTVNQNSRTRIIQHINEVVCEDTTNENRNENVTIGYSLSWLSPYDYSDSYPSGYKQMYNASVTLARNDYSLASDATPTTYQRYQAVCNNVVRNVTDGDMIISVGMPVYYATDYAQDKRDAYTIYGEDTEGKENDPVHMKQLGRVLASYAFFGQFMYNVEGVTLGDVDMTSSNYASYTLTAADKALIKESVNYSLTNPLTVPTSGSTPETPSDPGDTSTLGTVSAEDLTQYKNILILGNSHSQDTFVALPEVFEAQLGANHGYRFGMLIQAGSSMTDHANNIETTPEPEYRLYDTADDYSTAKTVTLSDTLKNGGWDIIFLQNGPNDLAEENRNMNKDAREDVENYILQQKSSIKIGYCVSWVAPYADPNSDGTSYTDTNNNNCAGAANNVGLCYQTTDYANYNPLTLEQYKNFSTLSAEEVGMRWKIDHRNPIAQHNKHVNLVRTYIVGDPDKGIARNSTYTAGIGIGTAIVYANQKATKPASAGTAADYTGQTATGIEYDNKNALYRDPLHLSTTGRIVASYAFFAQYTGLEVTSVNLTTYQTKPISLTTNWKNTIKETANWARQHTWEYIV